MDFSYIEGRLSRFSKIGGEMVPHETIEQKIIATLTMEEHSERVHRRHGRADAAKGEALVLLSSIDWICRRSARSSRDAGVPNLWIPRTVRRVEAIPVLASGKLDLAGCKKLAEQVTEAWQGRRAAPSHSEIIARSTRGRRRAASLPSNGKPAADENRGDE